MDTQVSPNGSPAHEDLPLVGIPEAARLLSVSAELLRQKVRRGEIRAWTVGQREKLSLPAVLALAVAVTPVARVKLPKTPRTKKSSLEILRRAGYEA